MGGDAKRTKRLREDEGCTLEELIARKRAALVADREEAPRLRATADDLAARAGAMTRRWERRTSLDLARRAAELRAEAGARESMTREHRFETMVVGYLRQYYSPAAAASASSRKRDSIQVYLEQSGAAAQERAAIVDEYLAEIDKAPAKVAMSARDECPRCDVASTLLVCSARSIMCCPRCGYAVAFLDSTSSSTSFDDMVEFSQYSYKRVNHYSMQLALVQGKETHQVPDEILEAVMADLYERVHVRSAEDITCRRVRESLRHLRLRKAYDHVTQITSRLSGRRPPRISPHVEDQLRNMFLQMQPAFQRHAPKSRTNFLSYSYVLYRCFQILGLTDMLEGITLLKGRDKLEANDAIFRKMSLDLGWPVFDLPPASETIGG